MNEEKVNENIKEIKTIKRANQNRRKHKKYEDVFLRISELKNSKNQYKKPLIVLKGRIIYLRS